VSASGINLSWSDNSNNETTFRIERSSDGVTFTEIDSVGSGVTSYAVKGLTSCSTYYFRVRARNAGGDSGYTNIAGAKTLGCQAPVLSVSTTSISQTITQGQTAVSQSFEVWNSGTGSMSFTVIVDQPWLSVSPTSASSSGENQTIQVNYNTSGLAAGQTYSATITVSATGATGSPQQITVWYTVIGAPCTTLPTPTPNCIVTLTTTTVTLNWSDVGNENGYELAVYSGGGCGGSPLSDLQLPANTTSYTATVTSAGSYSWRVRAKGNGTTYCDSGWSSCCPFTVPPAPQPILSLTPSSLSQTVRQGHNSPSQSFEVWNSGSGLLNYTIATNAAWVSVSPNSGASSGATNTHSVTYNTAGLAVGSYSATLTVSSTNATNSPQTISASLSVTATNNQLAKVAVVNPDNYRILKFGRLTQDGYFYPLANGTLADNVPTTNVTSWTGLGTSPDYLMTILSNAGYGVDVYTSKDFPSITLNDYELVIVQDPMTDITRQFTAGAVYNGVDFLEYTTDATFLSRLDSYFTGGGSVILVGDAVRLLENGTGRLNYGKTVIVNNAANNVTAPSSLIPSQWLFIRGMPFCCADRTGSGSNTVVRSSFVAPGAVVSQISLFDGNDVDWCEVWSETVYYPSDAVSLLDVRFQGTGQYVIDGSTCSPTVYQDTVSQVTSNLMGYTTVEGHKIFCLGSDSFFDLQSLSVQGNWHCSPPNSQTINCQITTDGVNAFLGLVAMAIGKNPVCDIPPIRVSNTLSTVDGTVVVKMGQTIGFLDGPSDACGNPLDCSWNFGDDGASTDCQTTHVFTNCGLHNVSVTISDGSDSASNGMTVAVACPMDMASLKLKANFKRNGADNCAIKGTLSDLPTGFSIANATVALDVGDAIVDFHLNAKGRGVNSNGNIKFSYNKKTGTWTYTGKLKGELKGSWATYGITSGTVISSDVKFPVLLMLQSGTLETFDAELPLSYSNRSGTSGTGTYRPVK
jgi:hypothetical protein